MTSPPPVGIVPAAGRAARLQPLSGSKEAILIDGRPLLDYLHARLRRAGCEETIVVTRTDKVDVIALAEERNLRVVLGCPATAAESLALGARDLDPNAPVLLGFPDTIWEPEDGFVQLLAALDEDVDVVLGLFRTPELTRSDVVVVDRLGLVQSVEAKPAVPRSDLIWGCAATRAGIVARLGEQSEAAVTFDRLARAGRVRGIFLSDSWLDVGTQDALAAARRRGA